MTLVIIK